MKQGDEEEDKAGYYSECHAGIDEPSLKLEDDHSKKKERDGDLSTDHSGAIGNIAKPPISHSFENLLIREGVHVSTSAVMDAANCAGRKHDMTDLFQSQYCTTRK